MGRSAAALLSDRISDPAKPARLREITPELIVRRSTGPGLRAGQGWVNMLRDTAGWRLTHQGHAELWPDSIRPRSDPGGQPCVIQNWCRAPSVPRPSSNGPGRTGGPAEGRGTDVGAESVASYVAHSLDHPWGRPRVVLGLDAEDARELAAAAPAAGGRRARLVRARARVGERRRRECARSAEAAGAVWWRRRAVRAVRSARSPESGGGLDVGWSPCVLYQPPSSPPAA